MQRVRCSFALTLAFFALMLPAGGADAAGFGIFTQGAAALGQADAVIAHGAGPSAIFFNPAQLADLTGTRLEIGTTLIAPHREYSSNATGLTTTADQELFFPSTIYLSQQLNKGVTLGIGAFSPFGLGTRWDDQWEGRYLATKSRITSYNVNPVLAVRLTHWLNFAAGIDLLRLDTILEQKISLASISPVLPDAGQRFRADGAGTGYNLGLLAKISKNVSIGISYRSRIKVHLKGDATFTVPDPSLATLFPNSDGRSSMTLPQQLFAGLAWRASARLTLETGVRWEDWSSFKTLSITLDQPVAGQTTISQDRNWHGSWAADLGGRFRLSERVSLLGGYLYSTNAVPDQTFEPAVPDANTHLFCIGTELSWQKVQLALSYGFQWQQPRSKHNSVGNATGSAANGRYRNDLHLAAVSLGYKF